MSAPPIPSIEPTIIVAGDTVQWTKSIPDYPATDGWTLKYSFQIAGSLDEPIQFSATTSGAGYSISVTAATTAAWDPANYIWTSFVEDATHRHRVGTGTVTILPDPEEPFGGTH